MYLHYFVVKADGEGRGVRRVVEARQYYLRNECRERVDIDLKVK